MIGHQATRRIIQVAVVAAIFAVLVWRLGTGPFLDGLRLVDPFAVIAAMVLGAITTLACAWRWRAVSRSLGVEMTFTQATAGCYRSLFLNTTLPFGVAGDVHRAVLQSRTSGDSRGARSVAWERGSGQAVQLAFTVVVLLLLPSPVRSVMVIAAVVITAIAIILVAGISFTRPSTATAPGRILKAVRDDVRWGLMARQTWPVLVTASFIIILGNIATFIVAARIVGTNISLISLATIALLLLAAMLIPLSIAGWGIREGAAAWIFAAVGLGASAGVTTAVVYGVMILIASLPGAAILAAESLRKATTTGVVHG